MAIGLRFKDQLPTEGKVRDEFEQLVAALNAELDSLRTVETVTVTNFIVSVQEVEITITAGNTTATATMGTPIDKRYTGIHLLGITTSNTVDAAPDGSSYAYISAITDTQITATREENDGYDTVIRVMLIQYRATALRQPVQLGVVNLTGAASATAGVQVVGPKYSLSSVGWSTKYAAGFNSNVPSKVRLTSSVLVTGSRIGNTGASHAGFCLVDFN